MDILKKIISNKKKEVESIKRSFPISNLEESIYFDRHLLSMKKSIIEKSGLISEFKRKSRILKIPNSKIPEFQGSECHNSNISDVQNSRI